MLVLLASSVCLMAFALRGYDVKKKRCSFAACSVIFLREWNPPAAAKKVEVSEKVKKAKKGGIVKE
ncbi:hypothetical protein Taro_023226 [Colocasia esculenta]|uniref:Secreted protein n=1 Tax=Colocasia esculenta TaxID=4460 RepID=A0A843UWT7_COLES|nr:hypothetical protein [Colocasia esculenta]